MIIAIDVGITSGICVLEDTYGRLVVCYEVHVDDLESLLWELRRSYHEPTVVAERCYPYKRARSNAPMRRALNLVQGIFPDVEWIDAVQWKTSDAAKRKTPRLGSAHKRDAYRIAHWALERALRASTESES